jgi:uracil-DNA glycosylase family 4
MSAKSPAVTETLISLNKEITACRLCPRLVEWREKVAREKRAAFKDWEYWGKPAPGFGDAKAKLLIVGLAPAAHGANRTGRVFTGDRSGTFLMRSLNKFSFANLPDSVSRNDGLKLTEAYINAIVRCAPPNNKPLPSEILNCRQYLIRELALLPNVVAVLALGKIAMDGYLQYLCETGHKIKTPVFKHGAQYDLGQGLPRLFVSYHVSQQNTQTGKLTEAMFDAVIGAIRKYVDKR